MPDVHSSLSLGSQSMQSPKVSIGMPVFNGEKFIRKSLDSLLAQTFSDYELIISDNASTDGTPEICEEYARKAPRIRYVRQRENRGALWNFRFVLHRSAGRYFMWAAADDFWDSRFLEACVECLTRRRDVGLCFTRFWITSRQFPRFFQMRRSPDMSFLSSDDVFRRVSTFILMNEKFHKANAIYGLWRMQLARQSNNVVSRVDDRYADRGLDIAQLVYALTRYKFVQLPQVAFYKTYKRFPGGSGPDRLLSRVLSLLKYRDFPSYKERVRSIDENIEMLRMALTEAHVADRRYEDVLNAKRAKKMRSLLS